VRRRRAFTLIELVIAAIVLALLAAVAATVYSHWTSRAYDTAARANLRAVAHSALTYQLGEDSDTWDPRSFQQALAAVGSPVTSPGVHADGTWQLVPDDAVPASATQISLALDGARAALVTRSGTGTLFGLVVVLGTDEPGQPGTEPDGTSATDVLAATTGSGTAPGAGGGAAPDPTSAPGSPADNTSTGSAPAAGTSTSSTPGDGGTDTAGPTTAVPAPPPAVTDWPAYVVDSTTATYTAQGVHVTGTFIVHGNVDCSNGFTLTGTLIVTGAAYLSGGCHIDGDVHAGSDVTASNGATVTGTVRTTGSLTLSGGATVHDATTGGPITVNNGARITATSHPNNPDVTAPNPGDGAPLLFDAAAWTASGWAVLTEPDCTQLPGDVGALADTSGPTALATSCEITLSHGQHVTLAHDTALISTAGILLDDGARLSAGPDAHGVYLIVPGDTSCAAGNGIITLSHGAGTGDLNTFVYTPCQASVALSAPFTGSLTGTPVTLTGGTRITQATMDVPHRR